MNLDVIANYQVGPIEQEYDWRDVALYALALGYGTDPLDEAQLAFVYETLGPRFVPSMCNTLAHPAFWMNRPELGIDWVRMLHAEQFFRQHAPLPPSGKVKARFRVASVEDKGADKGALLTVEKELVDVASGVTHFTVRQTVFLRGDGGQGGFGSPPAAPEPLPEGECDTTLDLPTSPQIALLYRLNGDTNALHADPAIAAQAGFRQPILHGLATMGVATRALLQLVCGQDPARLREMHVRFSSPVYPGETIRTEVYGASGRIRFRCRVVERDVIVLDRGTAVIE